EAGPAGVLTHGGHLDPAPDRGADLLGVGDEVVRDLLLGRETVRVQTGELQPRETVVPGRPVGHQGVPARRAPALGDPAAFQHQVRHTGPGQLLAHRYPGLSGPDDEDLSLLARPPTSLP